MSYDEDDDYYDGDEYTSSYYRSKGNMRIQDSGTEILQRQFFKEHKSYNFTKSQLYLLYDLYFEGIDISVLLDRRFKESQMEQISNWLRQNKNKCPLPMSFILKYAKPEFNFRQLKCIRSAFQRGVNTDIIADSSINSFDMSRLIDWLRKNPKSKDNGKTILALLKLQE